MNILITGGASGLGRAITVRLAVSMPDAKVYFSYRSGADAASELQAAYKNCVGIRCDFADPQDLENLAAFIEINDIDVLINNALARFKIGYAHKLPINDFATGFSENVLPAIRLTQAFITAARKRKHGKIITVLSSAIGHPPSGWGLYTAEKLYLMGMHQSWAKENIAFGITSNCISPAFMHTPLHNDMDERLIEDMQSKHPLKKLLTTTEVADVIYFLTTATNQLNGQNIVIDPV